jgi:Regulator of ribonuclease activity B
MRVHIFDLLRENAVADDDLLIKNDAQGDIFNKPRDVDFAFKTTDKEKADSLSEFINGKNYGSSHVEHNDGDDLFWIFVVVHMPITQHVLCSMSGFMVCLARLFQVEYDGWGSVIQSV